MSKFDGVVLTPEQSLPSEFVTLCRSVTAKRARTVIDHILKHGIITSQELREKYGYDDPRRGIRDVRETGIPLITYRVPSSNGRKIGAYTFDDVSNIKRGRIGGRKAFSKQFKQTLIGIYGSRDAFSGEALDERYLQIDHRVPYEVGGDGSDEGPQSYMLLDSSSQRAKSWSCEHCQNFLKLHDADTCGSCFWAAPEAYKHVAMQPTRRTEIVWTSSEVSEFDQLQAEAHKAGVSLQSYIKIKLSNK